MMPQGVVVAPRLGLRNASISSAWWFSLALRRWIFRPLSIWSLEGSAVREISGVLEEALDAQTPCTCGLVDESAVFQTQLLLGPLIADSLYHPATTDGVDALLGNTIQRLLEFFEVQCLILLEALVDLRQKRLKRLLNLVLFFR